MKEFEQNPGNKNLELLETLPPRLIELIRETGSILLWRNVQIGRVAVSNDKQRELNSRWHEEYYAFFDDHQIKDYAAFLREEFEIIAADPEKRGTVNATLEELIPVDLKRDLTQKWPEPGTVPYKQYCEYDTGEPIDWSQTMAGQWNTGVYHFAEWLNGLRQNNDQEPPKLPISLEN